MSLHRLEPGQIFHFIMSLLVICPNIKGALQQQFTKLKNISLENKKREKYHIKKDSGSHWPQLQFHPMQCQYQLVLGLGGLLHWTSPFCPHTTLWCNEHYLCHQYKGFVGQHFLIWLTHSACSDPINFNYNSFLNAYIEKQFFYLTGSFSQQFS